MSAPIVVATDFSDGATIALERAAALAKSWQAPLYVLHVFNDGIWASLASIYESASWYGADSGLATRRLLAGLASDLSHRYEIDAQAASASGSAAEQIARFATATEAALLVIGKQGEHWISDALIGETALKLAKTAALPVLVARDKAQRHIKRIIIATDFSENAFRAAEATIRLFPDADKRLLNTYAVQFEGRMRLAGASQDDIASYRRVEHAHAVEGMRAFAERLGPAKHLSTSVVFGFPAAGVLEASAKDVDLIVIGRYGRDHIEDLLLGSATRNILYHANCDVMLVP